MQVKLAYLQYDGITVIVRPSGGEKKSETTILLTLTLETLITTESPFRSLPL